MDWAVIERFDKKKSHVPNLLTTKEQLKNVFEKVLIL